MNIRNYIPNDHIMSINETVKWQAQMIQLLTIEINEKDKQINELQEQHEAYENMRKEAKYFIQENKNKTIATYGDDYDYEVCLFEEDIKDLLNILNKVGSDK